MFASILNFLKNRLTEASTYAGLSAVATGVGSIAKINETPHIVDAINAASAPMASGDWLGAIIAVLGSIAVLKKEGK